MPNDTVFNPSTAINRRTVLKGLAATLAMANAPGSLALGQAGTAPSTDITWLPAWRIAELINAGTVSAEEVTGHFLSRIATLEPVLHAFDVLDGDNALQQARAADQRRSAGESRGPLHGVPIAVKRGIAVKGLILHRDTETGEEIIASHDDILVERLRAAGAIIVGLTENPGMGISPIRPNQSFSSLESHPRNPWDPQRVPGSSSAGSAAAVAAAMLPLTIGTDGGGSTRLPAAISGVIGVHFTAGRVPFANYDRPRVPFMVTRGPMTRDMRDAALVSQIIAGHDGRDLLALAEPAPDYLAAIEQSVSGMRLAWTDDFGYGSMYTTPQSAGIIAHVRTAAEGFRQLGASVEATDEQWEDFFVSYLAMSHSYDGNKQVPKPSAEQLKNASESRARNWQRFDRLFARYDLLLSPCAPFTAYTVDEWHRAWNVEGDKYPHRTFAPTYTVNTHMFNLLGLPALSIPCGFIDGLPVGLQLVARRDREAVLYQAAAAFLNAFPRTERPPVS